MILFCAILVLLIGFIPNAISTNILHPAPLGGDSQSAVYELSERGCFWIDMKLINLVGKRFGRLVVVKIIESNREKRKRVKWFCRCDCGTTKKVLGESLRSGDSRSCGCFAKEHPAHFIHGGARVGRKIPEYRIWCAMRERCSNPNVKCYKNYGGRGITVCNRWLIFSNFISDMGRRPTPKHSIDRFPDNNGNYDPSNCRWATQKEQCSNTRFNRIVKCNGISKNLTQWSESAKISQSTLRNRLDCNWDIARAINEIPKRIGLAYKRSGQ
jgi:hypothetical protein